MWMCVCVCVSRGSMFILKYRNINTGDHLLFITCKLSVIHMETFAVL